MLHVLEKGVYLGWLPYGELTHLKCCQLSQLSLIAWSGNDFKSSLLTCLPSRSLLFGSSMGVLTKPNAAQVIAAMSWV